MKDLVLKFVLGQKTPLLVSLAFGLLSSLFYFVAGHTPGGGRLGAWYVLYYVGWPVTWLADEVISTLSGRLSERLFESLYVAGIIIAGMLWILVLAISVKYATAKLRAR